MKYCFMLHLVCLQKDLFIGILNEKGYCISSIGAKYLLKKTLHIFRMGLNMNGIIVHSVFYLISVHAPIMKSHYNSIPGLVKKVIC